MFSPRINEPTHLFILRWIARLLSIATIGFISLFLFDRESNWSDVRPQEMIGLVFFPFGLMFGLMLAWRRELAGGLVSVASIILFYLVYGLFVLGSMNFGMWIPMLAVPGVVFLVYSVFRREHWNGEFDSSVVTK
jgi:glucose-6-phosphate-specific signal transduction histidine kinase